MRLKKITLSGFKSFAETTQLPIESDVIAIVGPNGCGKSNLVDAVRWVLGEPSSRALRAKAMPELLFAGTAKKKAASIAEISLVLKLSKEERQARALQSEELILTRKAYSNGESECFLNEQPARLRDLQETLWGSGLGKNAFSVFEQGKLDQIIYLNPKERRVIFEEIADITRFLQRKKESLEKLAALEQNCLRLQDLKKEVVEQVALLSRQATQAEDYKQKKEKIDFLEKEQFRLRQWTLERKRETLEHKIKEIKQQLSEIEHDKEAQRKTLASLQEQLSQSREKLHQEIREQQSQEGAIQLHAQQLQSRQELLAESFKREERLKQALKAAEQETLSQEQERRKQEELRLLTVQKEEKQVYLIAAKESYSELASRNFVQLREEIKVLQKEHLQATREESSLTVQLQERRFRYDSRATRLATVVSLLEQCHLRTEAKEIECQEKRATVRKRLEQIEAIQAVQQAAEEKVQRLREELSEAQKHVQLLLHKFSELEGQQRLLRRLQEEMEGFSPAARQILKEAKQPRTPLYKRIFALAEVLVAKPGQAEWVASALKPYLETLLVETREDLERLLAYAAEKKLSGFSVVVKEEVAEIRERSRESMGPHSLLMSLEESLLAHHFGSHFERTEQGHFYDALRVLFHVEMGKRESKSLQNQIARGAELKAISQNLQELKEARGQAEQEVQERNLFLREAEKARLEILEKRRKWEMDLIQENFDLQRATSELEALEKEQGALVREKEMSSEMGREVKEIAILEKKQGQIRKQIDQLTEKLQLKQELIERQEKELAAAHLRLQQAESSLQRCVEPWRQLSQELEIAQARRQQSQHHIQQLNEEQAELQQKIVKLRQQIAIEQENLQQKKEKLQQTRTALQERQRELERLEKQQQLFQLELDRQKERQAAMEKEGVGHESTWQQLVSECEECRREEIECYGGRLEQLVSTSSLTREAIFKEIQNVRGALEKLGNVNLIAGEELEEKQRRAAYLESQLQDLTVSQKELEALMASLEEESRRRFSKSFSQIRDCFRKNFQLLFEGGEADLQLVESRDLLEAGIEIIAKPPGKQMRSLTLLSGGEKALTALALLFSIFEVKPAPFCILDEVDAPLDESNIGRFTHLLRHFTAKTQFLLVTHNKTTMAAADLLIGVSMEEKGISKVLSLDIATKRSEIPSIL